MYAIMRLWEVLKMDMNKLNPFIRSADIYERMGRNEECIAYDCRVIYVISGDITAVVDGVKLGHLSAGHLLYIPSGVSYKLKAQYVRAAVITFDTEVLDPTMEDVITPASISEFDSERLREKPAAPFDKYLHVRDMESERDGFIRMCNIFTSAEGSYRAQVSAMFKLVLLKIAETTDENALPSRMVEELDNYIRENVGDEISNTEIGAIFGYHPFYVSKVLKDRKGQTLRQYIINYRLKAAMKMLKLTQKSINEIADECGFTDASYFTKTFRTTTGMTPKEYRNQFKDDFI